jgi:hypothetical protein
MPKRRPIRGNRLKCVECARAGKPDPWYDASEFYRSGKRPDGTYRRDSYCIPCRLAFNRANRNALYQHDAGFRAGEAARHHRRWQRIAKENEGERRARREEAERLIARLKGHGWSGGQIAAAVGSSRPQVSKWGRGLMTPSLRNLALLRELARSTP